MKRRNNFISALLLLLCGSLQAQGYAVHVQQFGLEEGMPHRWVHQIIQDRDGFLWLATHGGLVRFDGHTFLPFPALKEEHGISNISYLQEDRDGNLWLKPNTHDSLFFLNPYTRKARFFHKGEIYFAPPSGEIQTIYRYHAKVLRELQPYLEYLEKGPGPTGQLDNMPYPILGGIKENGTDCIVTKKGEKELWVWYNLAPQRVNPASRLQHYARLDIEGNRWDCYHIGDFLQVDLANPFLPIDTEGRFWFPSLDKKPAQLFDFFYLPDDMPLENWRGIRVDNRQNIWIYDSGFRLYCYSLKRRQLDFITKLTSHHIEVCEDSEGTYWVGGEAGLLKVRRRKNLFENYMNEPFEMGEKPPIGHSMNQVAEIGEGEFLARSYDNWHHVQLGDRAVKRFETIRYPRLLYSKKDGPFFSMDGGHWGKYDAKTQKIQPIKLPEKQLLPASDLSHKVPTLTNGDYRLVLIDTLNNRAEHIALPNDEVAKSYLYWHPVRQELWANYSHGIVKMDLADLSVTKFQLFDHKVHDYIRAWVPHGDSVWAGTLDGLKMLDLNTGQFVQHYTTEHGLPNNAIYSALQSGKYLWLGTGNGLCRFDPKTLETRNFYVEDGLSHNEFNSNAAIPMSNGKLWMGGLNGVNIFDPRELENMEADEVGLLLAKFSKYDVKNDTAYVFENIQTLKGQTFNIRPNETSFALRFFLQSLIQPGKHRYYWYLEGYEPPWANMGDKPVATYQNVPPGNYTLKIKATDSRGNPAQNELNIPIGIIQVWYKRWWAWVMYALVLGGLGFAFYRYKINRKLEQQEAIRLKELDEVKNKLYTNITHEFRTPLTVILGTAAQIKGNPEKVELISRNGQNLLHLVNQMLDLSKLESGKRSVHLVQADMVNYVKFIAASFHSYAAMKDVELVFQSGTETCLMDFDRDKMLNIISNLLSNAIKFTPTGGEVALRLTVDGGRQTAGHSPSTFQPLPSAVISISDTGIGIPAGELPHIFDRFYQVDGSTTRQGEGTGIGLTLVKELVKLIGGEISVKSKEGEGSEFTLVLPVTNNAEITTAKLDKSPLWGHAALAAQIAPADKTENGEQSIVLIVEDNTDVAQYIHSCLGQEYQIIHAADGQIGIERAIETIPDIIISDVMMPNKDGFELVKTLKIDERTSHIPIILLTAKADMASRIEGLERGADAYLAKPFHQKELRVRLGKLIELRRKLQERYSAHGLRPTVPSPPATSQQPSANTDLEDRFLQKVKNTVLENLDDSGFGVPQLCRSMGMSQSQLYRKLKALTNKSIAAYIRQVRLHEGRKILLTTPASISEVAYQTGFSSLQYFSDAFFEEFGERPSDLHK